MQRSFIVATVALSVAGGALVWLAPLHAQSTADRIPTDTILEVSTNTTGNNNIWKLTAGKNPAVFAMVNP